MTGALATSVVVVFAAVGALAAPAAASKDSAFVSAGLLAEAQENPTGVFRVIVQGDKQSKAADVVDELDGVAKETPGNGKGLYRSYKEFSGAAAELTGAQIVKLAKKNRIRAITRDYEIKAQSYSNNQVWPSAAGVNWSAPTTGNFTTIAIFDSGVQPRPAFGTRLLGQVNFTSSYPNSSGDGRGHGTMVATVAAGADVNFTGAEPRARILSLDVLNDYGVGYKSDMLAACDWLLANKGQYNVRVANFSVQTPSDGLVYDAMNWCVEDLWLNGVVVVAAAGNYAYNGAQSNVGFAPANDPYVITVGASDPRGTVSRSDDYAAPWSAWGWTQDGFRKPEVSAPGRYINGGVPNPSTMLSTFGSRSVAGSYPAGTSYMWMSGTSFAAPVVAGIAATILAKNPTWSSDQVKGAIMQSVTVPSGYTPGGALGLGVVNASAALAASGTANPHVGLNRYAYYSSYYGRTILDAYAWRNAAYSNPSWNSASWSSASWSSASWSSASWSSASWSSASWANASWANASWANASWANSIGVE